MNEVYPRSRSLADLGCTLKMLDAVPVDIVVGPNRLAKLVADDHTRTFGGWTAGKEHDACTGICKSGLVSLDPTTGLLCAHLQKAHGDADGDAGTPQGALVVRDGPGITCELLEDARKLELDLGNRQQKAGGAKRLGRNGLARTWSRAVGRG